MEKDFMDYDKKEHLKFIDRRRKIICYKFIFKEFLARCIKFSNHHLTNYRKKIILEELKIAKISSEDEVLFIGCGLLPTTPMLIMEETPAKKITAIDNSSIIARLGESYINKKGLSDRIRIEYADGVNYPVENFDVIFIATNVWPIAPILRHLSFHMKNNARLICRDIKNDIKNVLTYESLYESLSIESFSQHPSGPDYKSLLLIKNDNFQKI